MLETKCSKCGINSQSGEKGKQNWNICFVCIKSSQRSVACGWCSRMKRMENKSGEKWVDQSSEEWHEDVKNHKSTCPTSFCSEVCEKEWQENQGKSSTSKEFYGLEKDEVNLKKSIEEHEEEINKLQKDIEFSMKTQPLEDEYQKNMLNLAFDSFSEVASEEEITEFVVKSRRASTSSSISIRTKAGYEIRMARLENENKVVISRLESIQSQNEELKEQNGELANRLTGIEGMLQQLLLNQQVAQQEQPPK